MVEVLRKVVQVSEKWFRCLENGRIFRKVVQCFRKVVQVLRKVVKRFRKVVQVFRKAVQVFEKWYKF